MQQEDHNTVTLRVELGRASLAELAGELKKGRVIKLSAGQDEPVDVYAGGRIIARGLSKVVQGGYAVRVTETIGQGRPAGQPSVK